MYGGYFPGRSGGMGRGWELLGTPLVIASGNQQDLILGSSSGDIVHTYESGYRYRATVRAKPGTVDAVNIYYYLEPDNETANVFNGRTSISWEQTPEENDMNTDGLHIHCSATYGFGNGTYARLERRRIV